MSTPNFRKSLLRLSKAQEKGIAVEVGGRRTAGSGNQPTDKGDVSSAEWLGEAKMTKSTRFGLTLLMWRKIEYYAMKKGKLPYMVIELAGRKLAVIRWEDFKSVVFF